MLNFACMRPGILILFILFRFVVFSQDTSGNAILRMQMDSIMKVRMDSIQQENLSDSLLQAKINVSKSKKPKKTDTTQYSPKKAALLALACPGLGQIYNKKYWKLPIVYGLMGGAVYFVTSQAILLRKYNGYLVTRENGGEDPYFNTLTTDELIAERDYYRRNVQLASFATALVWGLSIVDATVDAHMRGFDVTDKLSMQIKPRIGVINNERMYAAININFKLK